MSLADELAQLHVDLLTKDASFNFEGSLQHNEQYQELVKKYEISEREFTDDKQCGPDTWQVWGFYSPDHNGVDGITYIKIEGEHHYWGSTTWEYAYETMPIEVKETKWVAKNQMKGALKPPHVE